MYFILSCDLTVPLCLSGSDYNGIPTTESLTRQYWIQLNHSQGNTELPIVNCQFCQRDSFDGRSAGLSLPGQCIQHSIERSFADFETQFCTNSFQSLSIPTTLESMQQVGCNLENSCPRLSVIVAINLASSSADGSYISDMVCFCKREVSLSCDELHQIWPQRCQGHKMNTVT